MPLPAVLAAPPWVPVRKPKKIDAAPADWPERVVWRDGEDVCLGGAPREVTADDPTLRMDPKERDRHLLSLFEKGGAIIKIYAGQLFSDEGLERALTGGQPSLVLAYDLASIWLARRGLDGLPKLFELALVDSRAARAALYRIDSPRVARFLLEKSDPLPYFRVFPEHAGALLIPMAFGVASPPETAERARGLLRLLGKHDDLAALRRAAQAIHPDAVEELDAMFAPTPLPPKPPKLPPFADPAKLPVPTLRETGEPIPREAAERLIQILACLPLAAAHDAVASALPALDPTSLGELARALADGWIAADCPGKEKWALIGAGVVGDDLVARRIAELAVAWSNESKHARAGLAVEALGALAKSSDVALMWLTRMSTSKSFSKGIKRNAAAALQAFQESSGLSADHIGDRTAPDLGFDEHGRLTLDYGPRQFQVVFDEALKPALMDASKKPLRSLPKPAATDDAQKAARAKETWDVVKKEGPKIVEEQIRRLERAMCSRRTWTRAAWEKYVHRHPLMQLFARRLLWGAYEAGGKLVLTFRVAEDGSFAGVDDDAIEVPEHLAIGLVHPLALDADARRTWGDRFGDYAIVQPFRQLARELFAFTDEEKTSVRLTRYSGASVPGSRFFTLKARGWEFLDYDIGKKVAADSWVTLESQPGLEFLAGRPEDQTLGAVVLHGTVPGGFGILDPIAASELLRDVELLRA